MSASAKVVDRYVVPLQEDEMLVRFIEASEGLKRPPGVTAVEALRHLDVSAEDLHRMRKGLRAVMAYWREQIGAMQKTN